MKITPQNILLKSRTAHLAYDCGEEGLPCLLKSPDAEDAAALIDLMRAASDETLNLSTYPDEIKYTVTEEAQILKELSESPFETMVCAVIDGEIAANGGITQILKHDRYRHRAEFGISIKKEYWGLGIGTLILTELLKYSRIMGYEQVELEVVCTNERAIHLYEKMGFSIFGRRDHSFKYRDGSYADMFLMICYL